MGSLRKTGQRSAVALIMSILVSTVKTVNKTTSIRGGGQGFVIARSGSIVTIQPVCRPVMNVADGVNYSLWDKDFVARTDVKNLIIHMQLKFSFDNGQELVTVMYKIVPFSPWRITEFTTGKPPAPPITSDLIRADRLFEFLFNQVFRHSGSSSARNDFK